MRLIGDADGCRGSWILAANDVKKPYPDGADSLLAQHVSICEMT